MSDDGRIGEMYPNKPKLTRIKLPAGALDFKKEQQRDPIPEEPMVELADGMCHVIGCNKKATHEVKIALRVHTLHKPGLSDRVIIVCDEHKKLTLDDICTDDNWKKLCDTIEGMGRSRPKRKYSYLKFIPILTKV